jgi:uncharacterized surface protein with fasciclin (FAS1) repeats
MARVEEKAKTIVDLAKKAGNFKTLVDALQAADLVDTLKGKGPFTVFAPSDDAFKKLPKETRESIMKPANQSRLQRILKHHVVDGRKRAKDVSGASSLKMLDGKTLNVRKRGDQVRIGDATITKTDLEAENGVVHVIDRVLMPE